MSSGAALVALAVPVAARVLLMMAMTVTHALAGRIVAATPAVAVMPAAAAAVDRLHMHGNTGSDNR
jgi:hypothetical protein